MGCCLSASRLDHGQEVPRPAVDEKLSSGETANRFQPSPGTSREEIGVLDIHPQKPSIWEEGPKDAQHFNVDGYLSANESSSEDHGRSFFKLGVFEPSQTLDQDQPGEAQGMLSTDERVTREVDIHAIQPSDVRDSLSTVGASDPVELVTPAHQESVQASGADERPLAGESVPQDFGRPDIEQEVLSWMLEQDQPSKEDHGVLSAEERVPRKKVMRAVQSSDAEQGPLLPREFGDGTEPMTLVHQQSSRVSHVDEDLPVKEGDPQTIGDSDIKQRISSRMPDQDQPPKEQIPRKETAPAVQSSDAQQGPLLPREVSDGVEPMVLVHQQGDRISHVGEDQSTKEGDPRAIGDSDIKQMVSSRMPDQDQPPKERIPRKKATGAIQSSDAEQGSLTIIGASDPVKLVAPAHSKSAQDSSAGEDLSAKEQDLLPPDGTQAGSSRMLDQDHPSKHAEEKRPTVERYPRKKNARRRQSAALAGSQQASNANKTLEVTKNLHPSQGGSDISPLANQQHQTTRASGTVQGKHPRKRISPSIT